MLTELTKTQRDILAHLEYTGEAFTPRELAKAVEISYSVVGRALSSLFKEGYIRRSFARGNQFTYKFVSFDPVTPRLHSRLTSDEIAGFLVKWSKDKWLPRIFKSARNLPLGIGRLYDLAVEASFGGVIDNVQLNEVRSNLLEFQNDLEQTLRIVTALLETPVLWDANKIAAFLLESNKDPVKLQQLAMNVKERN